MLSEKLPLGPLITTSAAIGGAWLAYKIARVGRREAGLPLGPTTVPLLGNLAIFPKDYPEIRFSEWAKEYGDIFSLKLGSGTMIVLTSASAVRELLEQNSVATADRPAFYIANQVVSGMHLGGMRYGDRWKAVRRLCRDITTPKASMRNLPIQQAEASQLMHDLLLNPNDFRNSISRYATSVLMSVIFGSRVPQAQIPTVLEFFHMEHIWQYLVDPGAQPPIDLIPALKYVPERFTEWKPLSRDLKRRRLELYNRLVEQVKSRMKRGESNGCWMESILADEVGLGFDKDQIAWIGGSFLESGYDTSAAWILWLIALLVSYPEVQRKAQEEIESVVGTERAPTLDDLENLPYIQAVIKEVHRFRPTTPLLLPHATSADTSYRGYVIPAGAMIYANLWGMNHDERVFKDEGVFDPERFMKNPFGIREEALDEEEDWKEDPVFGYGRRACPGIHLAKNSISINVINLLWGFDFSKAKDPVTGQELAVDLDGHTKGLTVSPKPFVCKITPRSLRHGEVIEQQFQSAKSMFEDFERDLDEKDRIFVENRS